MDSPLTELLADLDSTWDIKTKKFLRRLENTADSVIKREDKSTSENIDILNADRIFIASGKEDLQYGVGLFSVLDTLDDRDRDGAYRALFHLLQGTFYIAGHAVIPVEAMKQSDIGTSQAALARQRRTRKLLPRIEIVRGVVAEKTKDGQKLPPVSKLIKTVNARLIEAGINKITERQLRSDLAKILHS